MSLTLNAFSELLDQLPVGIVVIDREGRVVHYNRYEEVLACRKRENVLGRDFFRQIAPCMNVQDLGVRFHRDIGKEPISVETEFSFPMPFLETPRDVWVRMMSFEVNREPHAAILVEDISARRSMERMKESLSGLLVHDLKNPLAVMLTHLNLLRGRLSGSGGLLLNDRSVRPGRARSLSSSLARRVGREAGPRAPESCCASDDRTARRNSRVLLLLSPTGCGESSAWLTAPRSRAVR